MTYKIHKFNKTTAEMPFSDEAFETIEDASNFCQKWFEENPNYELALVVKKEVEK